MREIRINAKEYGDRVVIETPWRDDWAVPAWEEMGFADLAGPFESISEAEDVLAANADYYAANGFCVVEWVI